MSNAKRPNLQRTRTPKDEERRNSKLDELMSIKVEDEVYTLRPADITGLAEMRIRRETGYGVADLMRLAGSSMGMDILGCYMFACEVAAGRDPSLEDILGSISWATDIDVVSEDESEPVPQP